MNANLRLALMVAFFVVVAAVVWHVLSPGGDETDPQDVVKPPTRAPQSSHDAASSTEPRGTTVEVSPRALRDSGPVGRMAERLNRDKGPKPLEKGEGVITGRAFIEATDQPVADADVTMRLFNADIYPRADKEAPQQTATTDADGEFSFTELAWGEYGVAVVKDNLFGVRSARIHEGRPEKMLEFKMKPAGSISGYVRNAEGEGIAGATIYPHRQAGGEEVFTLQWAISMWVETDDEGRFTIDNLWEGEWQLVAQHDDYATLVSDFITVGTTDAELIMGQGGSVSGTVVEASTSAPAPGVKLTITSEFRRDKFDVTSDESGAFQIATLSTGEYTAWVRDDAMVMKDSQGAKFNIRDAQETRVRVEVAQGGVIRGRVYKVETNEGIPGLVVRANGEGQGVPSREGEASDASGSYEIVGLGDGMYRISYEGAKGLPNMDWRDRPIVSVRIGQIVEGIDIPVTMGVPVEGRVIDAAGVGVPDVRVMASVSQGGRYANVKADDEGYFELAGFSASSELYIKAEKKGLSAPPLGPLTVPQEGLTGIEIVLADEAKISGTVVDKSGRPVEGARVFASSKTTRRFGYSSQTTDAQGEFTLVGLHAGAFDINVNPPGSDAWRNNALETVTLGEAEHRTGLRLVLDVAEGLSISGRVTSEKGESIERASVNASGRNSHAGASTDKDGSYTVSGLAEGPHYLSVSHRQYTGEQRQQVEAGSTNVDFVLAARGAIEGQVIAADTGDPITSFEIMQQTGSHIWLEPWMSERFARVHDEEGRFSLTGVEAKDVTVMARADGYAMSTEYISGVLPGETLEGVVIRLEPGALVEGTVQDPSGAPLAGASIYIGGIPPEHSRERGAAARTDAQGAFQLSSVGKDTTSISAYYPGYAPATVAITVDARRATRVDICLTAGGEIEGTVRVGGTPSSGQWVNVYNASAPGGNQSGKSTDENGFYRLTGLAAGTVRVSVHLSDVQGSPSGRNITREAVVEDGLVTVVDFDVPLADALIEGAVTSGGQPVKGGHVNVQVKGQGGMQESSYSAIKSDGTYRIESAPVGSVRLQVGAQTGDGGSWRTKVVDVETVSGRAIRKDIDFELGVVVSGTVKGTHEGEQGSVMALKGRVDLGEPDMASWQELFQDVAAAAQLGTDGVFRLEGLEPGAYTIFAFVIDTSGGQPTSPEDVFSRMRRDSSVIEVGADGVANVSLSVR